MTAVRSKRGAGLLLAMFLWSAATAGAQAGQSILQRGPLAVRGIPFLPPNILQAYRGEYLAADVRIEVYFTREPLVLPAGWRAAPCGQDTLLRVTGEDQLTLCYVGTGDAEYVLFFSFEVEAFPWCAWTEAFLQRLRYLLAFASEAPFPAVFQYRKGDKG